MMAPKNFTSEFPTIEIAMAQRFVDVVKGHTSICWQVFPNNQEIESTEDLVMGTKTQKRRKNFFWNGSEKKRGES